MSPEQKQKIIDMRQQGLGYKQIAASLNLSANTIKSFCRRNGLSVGDLSTANVTDVGNTQANNDIDKDTLRKESWNKDTCKQCSKPLNITPKVKPKSFCCDKCRIDWWNRNRKGHMLTCARCGVLFRNYDKSRKYCGHACYISDRFISARTEREGTSHDQRAI